MRAGEEIHFNLPINPAPKNGRLGYSYHHEDRKMSLDRIINAMAGTFILLSLSLGVEASPIFHNPNWLWLTAFVGANLFQSSFTGFCPAAIIFKKLGVKPGLAFS